MSNARIHNATSSTQSNAESKAREWLLEFAPAEPIVSTHSLAGTVRATRSGRWCCRFASRDDAVAYAKAQGWAYDVEERRQIHTVKPKSYADNFRYGSPDQLDSLRR